MDTIDSVLNGFTHRMLDSGSVEKRVIHPAVVRAISLGCSTLQRYYIKTGACEVYWLAIGMEFASVCNESDKFTVLHPSSKMEYFKVNKYDIEWIEGTEDRLRREYSRYKTRLVQSTTAAATTLAGSAQNIVRWVPC